MLTVSLAPTVKMTLVETNMQRIVLDTMSKMMVCPVKRRKVQVVLEKSKRSLLLKSVGVASMITYALLETVLTQS
jgi:hypothetical protein